MLALNPEGISQMTYYARFWLFAVLSVVMIAVFSSTAAVGQTVLRVDGTVTAPYPTSSPPGNSWQNAFRYLQDALSYIDTPPGPSESNQFEIWVRGAASPGITYRPNQFHNSGCQGGCDNPDATFQLRPFVQIYGGFAGTESALNQRNVSTNLTILSGQQIGTVSRHVVSALGTFTAIGRRTILDGLVIRAGNAQGAPAPFGGGILIQDASPLICRCTIKGNLGGGVAVVGLAPANPGAALVECAVNDNAAQNGAGIYVNHAKLVLANCEIRGNETPSSPSLSEGGGIHMGGAIVEATNTLITDNRADGSGAGVKILDSEFFGDPSTLVMTNCTIAHNRLWGDRSNVVPNGTGMDIERDYVPLSSGPVTLRNTIVAWNGFDTPNEIRSQIGAELSLRSCDVYPNPITGSGPDVGASVISQNPTFISIPSGDYRISILSPCRNRGVNSFLPPDDFDLNGNDEFTEITPVDIELTDRFCHGHRSDMGTYRGARIDRVSGCNWERPGGHR